MSLEFETTFMFARDNVNYLPTQHIPAVPRFIVNATEAEVWIGWDDGYITAHTSMHLEYTLDQPYYFDNQTVVLPAVTFGDGRPVHSATKWYDTVYVTYDSEPKIAGYQIDTKTQTFTASIPFTKGSDLVAANGALWMTDLATNASLQNTLRRLDIATGTWTSYIIPLRHQTTQRKLIDGLDGKLWITCKNNHSIVSFDTVTNTFGTPIKISRHPTNFAVNQNKELFALAEVSIIKMDQSTGTPTTFSANLGHTTMIDDLRTGFMWLVGGGQPTYRMVKSTVGVVAAGPTGVQNDDSLRAVAAMTNQYTYDDYNIATNTTTSLTIRPYLFILTATTVYAYRATALKGVNSSQILGTGMIALGPQGYYGG